MIDNIISVAFYTTLKHNYGKKQRDFDDILEQYKQTCNDAGFDEAQSTVIISRGAKMFANHMKEKSGNTS